MVVTLAGVVTERELDDVTETVLRDPARDPSWPALVDASKLNPAGITTELLRARANVVRANPVPVAVVAPKDVVFGLARMFQMMSEGIGALIEVFRNSRDALAWLDTSRGDG